LIEQPIEVDWFTHQRTCPSRKRPTFRKLKLILEAISNVSCWPDNQARPQAQTEFALYRLNGLDGTTPAGNRVGSGAGIFKGLVASAFTFCPWDCEPNERPFEAGGLIIQRDQAKPRSRLAQHAKHLPRTEPPQSSNKVLPPNTNASQAFRVAARTQSRQQGLLNINEGHRASSLWSFASDRRLGAIALVTKLRSLSPVYNTELARLELPKKLGHGILQEHNVRLFENGFVRSGPLGRLGEEKKCLSPQSTGASASVARYGRRGESTLRRVTSRARRTLSTKTSTPVETR